MSYNQRISRFRDSLQKQVDLIFLPLSADLQYLTGIPRDFPNFGAVLHPGGWLEGAWITPHHDPVLTLTRMASELGGLSEIKQVEVHVLGDWDDPAKLVQDILKKFKLPAKPRVAISDRTLGETISALHRLLPEAVFSSATELLRPMRIIKSEEEIAIMKEAGAITEAAFADVLAQLKHGMTEIEILSEVDYQLRRHGSLGPSFTTSFYNSGPNHPLMFGQRLETWQRVLTPPVSLLFDFGAIHNGYCYDYGRTVSFGEPDVQFQRVYELVMASQAAGIAALRANEATAESADAAARKIIEDAGYGEAFRHRLGHGIGLDVHEPPFLTKGSTAALQEGMMFTVEPSITLFHEFSARVEDVVVVRAGGGEALTRGYQELIVVD